MEEVEALTRRKSKPIGPVTTLGLVITIVGLLLPFLGVNVWSVAVIVYDPNPPKLENAYPAALFEDSPTKLTLPSLVKNFSNFSGSIFRTTKS